MPGIYIAVYDITLHHADSRKVSRQNARRTIEIGSVLRNTIYQHPFYAHLSRPHPIG